MLDLVGLVVSTAIMVYAVFRAVQVDGSTPWFPTRRPAGEDDAASSPSVRPAAVPWRERVLDESMRRLRR